MLLLSFHLQQAPMESHLTEEIPGIEPGCCGEEAVVNDLISNLRQRKDMRGGVAQMRKLDRMVEKLGKITGNIWERLFCTRPPENTKK